MIRLKGRELEYLFLVSIFILVFFVNLRSAMVIMPRKDELEYIWRAEELLRGTIAISPQHSYFFSLILAFSFLIFGKKLIVAQIVTVFISTMAVIAIHFFAKQVFVDKSYNRELGLTVALLASVEFTSYSVKVRNDLLFVLFFLLACFFALKGIEDQKFLKFTGVFAGLAYLTRDPGMLIIPVLAIYFLLNRNEKRNDIMQTSWKGKFVQYKNHLIMIGIFLLLSAPKLFWKWYLFGSPFYTRTSYFWLDTYEDKYNTSGYLPDSFDYRPSLKHYLQHHTLQQIIDRWLLGMNRLIITLKGMTPTFSILSLILLVIGILIFIKKRVLLLHLNIVLWFFVFSWLYGVRHPIRWILPMYPFILILIVAAGFEMILWLSILTERIPGFRWPAFTEKIFSYASSNLSFLIGYLNLKKLSQMNLSSRKIYIIAILFVALFISVPTFLLKAQHEYTTFVARSSQSAENYRSLMDMVNWAKANTAEDAIFMARDGHDLLSYYANREAIITPNGNLSLILWVIQNEGVDYLVIDSKTLSARPALQDIFEGSYLPEGFTLVYKNYEGNLDDETPELKIQVYTTNWERVN